MLLDWCSQSDDCGESVLEGLEVLEELRKGSGIVTEEVNGKSPGDTLRGTLGEEAKVVDLLTETSVGDCVSDCEVSTMGTGTDIIEAD